jgi:cytochrome c1
MTFRNSLALCAVLAFGAAMFAAPAKAAEAPEIASQDWSFAAPFGRFDQGQLQRGYKVYKEGCAGCHGLSFVAWRNLSEIGGPRFSEAQVRTLAAEAQVQDGPNDQGEMFDRPATPADRMPSPFPNEQAARAANNGAYPPDLSLMAKARPAGPDYIYALLTGYTEAPEGFEMSEGMSYNAAFPGHQIAMPQPLSDGQIEYTDGTEPTLHNYAKDISAFLMWTAEPHLNARHQLGLQVMLYLFVLAVLVYLAKRQIWHGRREEEPTAPRPVQTRA